MAKRPTSSGAAPPKFTEFNDLCDETVGGKILFATDDFFAEAENLLKSSEPEWRDGVFTECGKWMDGWETRRRRIPGHDWAIIKLGIPGIIKGVCIDTAYFTGNFVPKISLQAARLQPKDELFIPERKKKIGNAASKEQMKQIEQLQSQDWTCLVPMSALSPGYEDTRHNYFSIPNDEKWTHVRLNLYPDGGIARLRIYGKAKLEQNAIFEKKIDLISALSGSVCIGYSDAHYGHPRNIIKPGHAINMGDGWETARRLDRPSILKVNENNILQVPGNEWSIFQLGCIGIIEEIEVDTSHFKGNFPDSITIEGTNDNPLSNNEVKWEIILPTHKLFPDKKIVIPTSYLSSHTPFEYVRATISPDGGISRLRLYGSLI